VADARDTEEPLDRLLEGWGTPSAKPEFVDRVLARVDVVESAQPRRRRWGLALTFTLGGLVGGLVVGSVMAMRDGASGPARTARRIHLQAPGVAEVVGEPGSQLQWELRDDGFVLEVVEGVAWVRRVTESTALRVTADGEDVQIRGLCGRVEVTRSLLSVDASVDEVDCELVDAAIEAASAELSDARSR
jgi:hypothetical protein